MRSWEVIIWVAPFFLSYNVNGAPIASSLSDLIGHGAGADIVVANSCSLHRAEATHRFSDIARRAPVDKDKNKDKDKGKGKGPAPPDAPKKDQGQRPATSPSQSPATPPGQRPTTPQGQRPVTPPGRGEAYKLGECGTNKPGIVISKPAGTGSPSTSPKRPATGSPPRTPFTPTEDDDGDETDEDNLSNITPDRITGAKSMFVCTNMLMTFPAYPSSGEAVRTELWRNNIDAYNAARVNPCDNDYTLVKIPFPKHNKDRLHNRPGAAKQEEWQTEHTMDGQILKSFFQTLFEGFPATKKKPKVDPKLKRTEIPRQWRSSVGSIAATQTQCDYLQQFWEKRWPGKDNAMKYLLSQFPSKTNPTEFLFLPGRLNIKKAALFGVKPKNVVTLEKFKKMPLHQQIDELREVVLLTARIYKRLQEIEETDYMRVTDDYWVKQRGGSHADKDAPSENYAKVGLAQRWLTFMNGFVDDRTQRMAVLLEKLHYDLEQRWTVAQTYADLKREDKVELERRIQALKVHRKDKVNASKLHVKSLSRPSTPVTGNPGGGAGGQGIFAPNTPGSNQGTPMPNDGSPGVPDETPSKPAPGRPITIPIRPNPNAKPNTGSPGSPSS
ncbi:hypothetical protein EKO04_009149 [Ascochyta lentis]|uniref:Uncharacterized protein n=1 Tax=Ascochyta lentis TaxID=205686 RepID=A0A8H7IY88_9PLEO|nr:hypothetical protein EKO04_009149 [Ascochyta lentis]